MPGRICNLHEVLHGGDQTRHCLFFKNILAGVLVGSGVIASPSVLVKASNLSIHYLVIRRFENDLGFLLTNSIGNHLDRLLFLAWALKPLANWIYCRWRWCWWSFRSITFGGALLGYIFAVSVNMIFGEGTIPIANSVLVGLGGMMAGVLHAPLTAIFLASEISGGYDLFVPLMLSSALAMSLLKS